MNRQISNIIYISTKAIIISLLSFAILLSQTEEEGTRITQIDTLFINSKEYLPPYPDDIVIAESDSISFAWSCRVKNVERSRFLFRIILNNAKDTSNHVFNITSLTYKQLKEENYTFKVQAFDPAGNWLAPSAIVNFRVHNQDAQKWKELDSLREALSRAELKSETAPEDKLISVGLLEVIISVLAALLGLAGIIAVVMLFISNKKRKKIIKNKVIIVGEVMETENVNISKDEYKMLIAENTRMQNEINSLRNQIDAMQSRGQELSVHNKELQEKVQKLSSSKNELEELQNQKDELFTMVIHDIKNPASLIKSLVELLRSYDLTATEQQDVINDIVETSSRIVSLSQEVSRILALEGSRLILDFESVPINEIIEDVMKVNHIAAANKSIRLLSELEDKLPDVQVDPQKFAEIIDNLLSNAIKFTQKGGTVRVRSHLAENSVVVDVSDNGLGLSENDIKNAFQRGARLSAKPTEGESSSGLGLWIVKKLIEAHHGRVWVKSALGKGSTFSVSIPMIRTMEEESVEIQ